MNDTRPDRHVTEPAIACTLTHGELRCQAAVLLPGLAARAARGAWTDLGMRLHFRPTSDDLLAIAQTIDHEHVCCAFLTFRLEVPASGGEFVLDVSGPAGTRSFLEGLGLSFPSA